MRTIHSCLLLTTSLLIGCSDVARIGSANNANALLAADTIKVLEPLQEYPEVSLAIDNQVSIINNTKVIAKALGGVEDKTPWWASWSAWIIGGLIALAGIFLFIYCGGASLVRKVVYSFTVLIPEPKKDATKLLSEGFKANDIEKVAQGVAVLRTADPALNAAFKKESKANDTH